MAAISLPFLATTSLNSPSTSSGESTTRTRAGVSDKLHQARDALADGRSRPRRSVQDLVTVGDSYRAFQNYEMVILSVMTSSGVPEPASATNSSTVYAPPVSLVEVRILNRSPGEIFSHSLLL